MAPARQLPSDTSCRKNDGGPVDFDTDVSAFAIIRVCSTTNKIPAMVIADARRNGGNMPYMYSVLQLHLRLTSCKNYVSPDYTLVAVAWTES